MSRIEAKQHFYEFLACDIVLNEENQLDEKGR